MPDDHAVVRLRSLVGTDAGILLPNAIGTIVYRHADGNSYEVEFTDPVAQVITLHAEDVSPAE
ncbi:DUF4926 domain-containing protein [Sphingomonas sp. A2-49]|uniref:DUF4926 domain-containing protein n=1 Tax=Sphingomonas sp. A2-49 TaxID=1391375 RepID=UPI0021D3A854|nr:DUF4926 domain-containing protein [Sphingomonas sp. A2-49]MCU6452944.1 DUF4926 domain-containing protein [Sphingomonas sp. A2-49]